MKNELELMKGELEEKDIRQALVARWGFSAIKKLALLKQDHDGRSTFRVDTSDGSFVLKIANPKRQQEVVEKDIYALHFLKDAQYPVPELVKTAMGEDYEMIVGRHAYVLQWIEGKNLDSTEKMFGKLGEMTARLHAIEQPYKYNSDFVPLNEIKKLLVRAHRLGIDQKYVALLQGIHDVSNFPKGIIHTDIGPHNAIERPDGGIVIIDWDDAGLGPVIIDVGWELEQCLSHSFVFEMEKAKSFIRGYTKYRVLSLHEQRHAYDMALFFEFFYGLSDAGFEEFGKKRIDWFAAHRDEFEHVFE